MIVILFNSGVVDFIIIGCGIGIGVMFVCNSFFGVVCGFVVDFVDVYLFF